MKKLFFSLFGLIVIGLFFFACEEESLTHTPDLIKYQENDKNTVTQNDNDLEVYSAPNPCNTIPGGDIVDSDGDPIEVGFNEWGYNYQAHMFNGGYCDAYKDADWCQPYADVQLLMKWNEAWLSNKDCDDDGLLDRHFGYDTYIGSGAWLTNHQWGIYYDEDGNECEWDYFVKIIAAPADATAEDGIWYNVDGTEIGPVIWGSFAIIQQVENDPCAGISGMQYISPDHPGLGNW